MKDNLKSIKGIAITCLILKFLVLIFAIVGVALTITDTMNANPNGITSQTAVVLNVAPFAVLSMAVIFAGFSLLLALINGILILTYNCKGENLRKIKVPFGVLTLLSIFSTMLPLIFVSKAEFEVKAPSSSPASILSAY